MATLRNVWVRKDTSRPIYGESVCSTNSRGWTRLTAAHKSKPNALPADHPANRSSAKSSTCRVA